MTDYKESTVEGTSYQRSFRITIENKRGDTPHITFFEEQVITLADEIISRPVDQCTQYFNPGETFPLLNPLDDSPLGADGSHQQFQILLYSLYKATAAKRDTEPT